MGGGTRYSLWALWHSKIFLGSIAKESCSTLNKRLVGIDVKRNILAEPDSQSSPGCDVLKERGYDIYDVVEQGLAEFRQFGA